MNALDCQIELKKELEKLFLPFEFQKFRIKENEPEEKAPMHVFKQAIPTDLLDDERRIWPYCIPQIVSGDLLDEYEPEDIKINIQIGVFCDNLENVGHELIINVIETFRQRILKNRVLADKYMLKLPLKWQLSEEDSWPCFFGAIETHWALLAVLSEEPNL